MGELGIIGRVRYGIRTEKSRKGKVNKRGKLIRYLIRFLLSFLVILESIS